MSQLASLTDLAALPLPAGLAERLLRLTTTEGKYHLVKRMIAAAGNRAEGLNRVAIGGLSLPPELPLGQWIWLEEADLQKLAGRTP